MSREIYGQIEASPANRPNPWLLVVVPLIGLGIFIGSTVLVVVLVAGWLGDLGAPRQ